MVKKFMLMLLASLAIGMITVSAALAEGTLTVSSVKESASAFNLSLTNSSVASVHGSATLNGKLEVRAIMPHGLPKSERHHCEWNDFAWSDWETSNGGKVWAPAGHHGWTHACKVHGVWRQIGGGPGQWNCGNVVKPIGAPLPHNAVKVKWSEIVVVKHFTYTVSVNVKAEAKKEEIAMASCALPGAAAAASVQGSGLAVAEASASGTASSEAEALVKAKAGAEAKLGKDEATLLAEAKTEANVKLNGSATAFCASQERPRTCTELGTCPPPSCTELGTCPPSCKETHTCSCTETHTCSCEEEHTCPPPPEHWVHLSCTGFEELSGRASMLIDCAVEDDNGAPIFLKAEANDGNSRVSGISCISHEGAQTCPGKGTFEFRVSGKNEGVSVLESSVTVTATANEVSASLTESFPVDPAEGGF